MNLSQTSSFLKRYRWILTVVSLIAILTPLVILSFMSKGPEVTPPPPAPLEKIAIETGSFDISQLALPTNFPEQMPIFSQTSASGFLNLAPTLAAKLGFKKPPIEVEDINLGKGIIYSEVTSTLGIYNSQISLQRNFKDNKPRAQNIETLTRETSNLISSLGLKVNLAEPDVTYFKSIDEFIQKTLDPLEANAIELNFNENLEGYKVLAPSHPIRAKFDPSGHITSLTITSLPTFTKQNTYPLIDPKSALSQLQNGRASLIRTTLPNDYTPLKTKVGTIQTTGVSLVYYLPAKVESPVIPVWLFMGTNPENDGEYYYAVSALKTQNP